MSTSILLVHIDSSWVGFPFEESWDHVRLRSWLQAHYDWFADIRFKTQINLQSLLRVNGQKVRIVTRKIWFIHSYNVDLDIIQKYQIDYELQKLTKADRFSSCIEGFMKPFETGQYIIKLFRAKWSRLTLWRLNTHQPRGSVIRY